MRSKASLRVCSQSLLKSEMLPPTMVCKLAPMVPTMERERTTIPRTTPRLRFTRKPGSSNAVVTNSCGTMSSPFCRTPFVGRTPLAPIDLDHRRVFNDDGPFQRIYDAEPRGAIDGGLRGVPVAVFARRGGGGGGGGGGRRGGGGVVESGGGRGRAGGRRRAHPPRG